MDLMDLMEIIQLMCLSPCMSHGPCSVSGIMMLFVLSMAALIDYSTLFHWLSTFNTDLQADPYQPITATHKMKPISHQWFFSKCPLIRRKKDQVIQALEALTQHVLVLVVFTHSTNFY